MAETTTSNNNPKYLKHIGYHKWFIIPICIFWATGLFLKIFFQHGEEVMWFNNWRVEPLNSIFRFITKWGEWYPYVFLGLPFLLWRYRIVLVIAIAGLLTIPSVTLLKHSFQSPRPHTYFQQQGTRDQLVTVPETHLMSGGTSFPSGHSTSAFTIYTLLTLGLYEIFGTFRQGLLLALAAILAAVSRVFLAQHFLSDILAGSLMGIILGSLFWWGGLSLKRFPALEKGLLTQETVSK
jgi:membrane-associated phospholipid phosphatase